MLSNALASRKHENVLQGKHALAVAAMEPNTSSKRESRVSIYVHGYTWLATTTLLIIPLKNDAFPTSKE